MVEYLYRFRTAERLLQKGELAAQEIFFAHPSTLNDPMEGFRDVFWLGDDVIWQGLLKHYLLCLGQTYMIYACLGEEHQLDPKQIPVLDPYSSGGNSALDEYKQQLVDTFFADDIVCSYVSRLAQRVEPVRQEELLAHLRALHLVALDSIQKVFHLRGLLPSGCAPFSFSDQIRDKLLRASDGISLVDQLLLDAPREDAARTLFSIQIQTEDQLRLIGHYAGTYGSKNLNKQFVTLGFPDAYFQLLEQLMYPEWYVACFMDSCRNSSIWGSYGDNHTGVCLKFRTDLTTGAPRISLKTPSGWNGELHFSEQHHEFKPVKYQNGFPTADFFNLLGRLPIGIVRAHWHRDANGKTSKHAEAYQDTDDWRKKYWNSHNDFSLIKSMDWHYEREYRLILSRSLDLSDLASRKLQYGFSSLDGIIFGIKTSRQHKMEIIRIIEAKCRALGRSDFKFYQAHYSHSSHCIDYHELRHIRFSGLD